MNLYRSFKYLIEYFDILGINTNLYILSTNYPSIIKHFGGDNEKNLALIINLKILI